MTERAPLDAARLRVELGDRWARLEVVDEAESTNTQLLADHAAPDRSALAAELQTSGRGRLDRTWASPARAGLTFSALFRPDVPVAAWGWLPLLAGVAVHDAVPDVVLKWPNDVLWHADERKLAGILAQSSGDTVVIGIGLNVSTAADELPVPTATSLALCGRDVDRTELLVEILRRLDARVAQWTDVGGDAEACGLHASYTSACVTVGREVAVTTTSGERLEAVAVAVEPDGRLRLGSGDVVGAGDVEHLRPAR